MKKLKGLLLCLISLIALNVHADSVVMKLNLKGDDLYNISGDTLNGVGSLIKGSFSVRGNLNGQNIDVAQAIPVSKMPNDTQMIIKDKNTVEVIDATEEINGDVRAKVKKSIFGKLKSIQIDSDSYLALMRPALEASGFSFLSQLNISADEGSISSHIEVSDIDCEADGNQVSCSSDIEIKISIISND